MGVLEVKDKVQRFLTEKVGRLEVDRDGDFTFRHGSSRIFVSVSQQGESATVVRILSPVLLDVPASPELYKYVACNVDKYVFGHLVLKSSQKEGQHSVFFAHNLLGDYLDAEELHWAVGIIAVGADDWDNELRDKFGGRLFHED